MLWHFVVNLSYYLVAAWQTKQVVKLLLAAVHSASYP